MTPLISEGADTEVTFERRSLDHDRYGASFSITIEHNEPTKVGLQRIAAQSDEVWFHVDELERFLANLRRFEWKERERPVTLHAMSPHELTLTFAAVNKALHIGVSLALGGYAGFQFPVAVTVAFKIETTELHNFIEGMQMEITA